MAKARKPLGRIKALAVRGLNRLRPDDVAPPAEELILPHGGGDFEEIGREFLGYFVDLGGLRRSHDVLDIGCGIGRMAVPLTTYLKKGARYEGFDVIASGVYWCQDNITPRHRNFRFQRADIFSHSYNPEGSVKASEYRFPYPDESFDFAFATSVFTHMLPDDLDNYLAESSRVLRPGGTLLATWFLIDDLAKKLLDRGKSTLAFSYVGPHWTIDPDKPTEAVAYRDEWVMDLYRRHGLEPTGAAHRGEWSGRDQYVSYQDIIVAQRRRDPQ